MSEGERTRHQRKRSLQLAGLLMWRAGLLLAAGTAVYNGIKLALRFIDLPLQLEIGIGLVITGVVFVAFSFVMERLVDYRAERDLSK